MAACKAFLAVTVGRSSAGTATPIRKGRRRFLPTPNGRGLCAASKMTGGRRLVLSSTNPHKIAEFRALLAGAPFELLSPADLGVTVQVEETGDTFDENAILKALAYAEATGLLALADDSGLEIDALGGAPGVHSARWAGVDTSHEERFRLLEQRLPV